MVSRKRGWVRGSRSRLTAFPPEEGGVLRRERNRPTLLPRRPPVFKVLEDVQRRRGETLTCLRIFVTILDVYSDREYTSLSRNFRERERERAR